MRKMTNLVTFEDLRKEFQVDENGVAYCSRRAIARMTGKNLRTIRSLLQNISEGNLPHKMFKTVAVLVPEGDGAIPDTLASAIIQYYAFKGSETAQNYLMAFSAIGIRSTAQKITGWTQGKKEYGNMLLREPRQWSKVFGDEFYDELTRLTGWEWDRQTHQRPCIFAKLTYDLVYSHLPNDIYETIKKTQKEHGGYLHKMHQYLNEEGLQKLKQHLELCLNILSAVSSVDDAKLLVNQSVTRNYQRSLFSV
jgi:hypothetical protein